METGQGWVSGGGLPGGGGPDWPVRDCRVWRVGGGAAVARQWEAGWEMRREPWNLDRGSGGGGEAHRGAAEAWGVGNGPGSSGV